MRRSVHLTATSNVRFLGWPAQIIRADTAPGLRENGTYAIGYPPQIVRIDDGVLDLDRTEVDARFAKVTNGFAAPIPPALATDATGAARDVRNTIIDLEEA